MLTLAETIRILFPKNNNNWYLAFWIKYFNDYNNIKYPMISLDEALADYYLEYKDMSMKDFIYKQFPENAKRLEEFLKRK